ncbi:hypothetical protein CMO91_00680 [Candidatus Woesearchaeota archaeon]|nr:hypothetical protein [Candidatus Woesearchaeota archaeon]
MPAFHLYLHCLGLQVGNGALVADPAEDAATLNSFAEWSPQAAQFAKDMHADMQASLEPGEEDFIVQAKPECTTKKALHRHAHHYFLLRGFNQDDSFANPTYRKGDTYWGVYITEGQAIHKDGSRASFVNVHRLG